MNEAAIRRKITELTRMLQATPAGKKAGSGGGEGVYVPTGSQKGQSVPQKLDELRLQLNYLLFDLEATRRENRYLMQMLEARRKPKRDDDDLLSF